MSAKKLVQINVAANWGSTGRIAEGIGETAIEAGWESYIAYGRYAQSSLSKLIKIGNRWDQAYHLLQTRLLDRHGMASIWATKRLLKQMEEIEPTLVHLHNIHGYFLNYPILFDWLKHWGGPVVWTLHDCWPFTGHCAYYDLACCDRWQLGCHHCPQLKSYPQSLLIDRSFANYENKRRCFTSLKNMTIITVSDWLKYEVEKSFLVKYPIRRIYNGIDLSTFHSTGASPTKMVLGIASVWDNRKGLADFIAMRAQLPDEIRITLVGLSKEQIKALPKGITGIERTNSIAQLCKLYSEALAFVNPTWEDNFPTTNLEALACGTPIITYRTGGSIEAVDNQTGLIVDKGDINGLVAAIESISENRHKYTVPCRQRAEKFYSKRDKFRKYVELYDSFKFSEQFPYDNMLINTKKGGVSNKILLVLIPERRAA